MSREINAFGILWKSFSEWKSPLIHLEPEHSEKYFLWDFEYLGDFKTCKSDENQ